MLGLQTIELNNFKGLYHQTQKLAQDDVYFTDCKDWFVLNNESELLARPGFVNLNTSATLGKTASYAYVFKTATVNQILLLRGASGMDVWTPPNVVSNFNVLSHAFCKWILQYNNNAYILGGATIYQYDGAAETSLAGTPQIGYGIIHKDRMFGCTLSTTNPSRVYYSDVGNMASWPGSNFFDVNPGDGQSVTGMVGLGDRLVIFKDRSTYVMLTQDGSASNWTLTKINDDIGCRSPNSIKVLNGLIYFISNRNIHRTDGLTFQDIGDPVILRPTTNFLNALPFNPSGGTVLGFWSGVWRDFYITYLDWYGLNSGEVYLFNSTTGAWWCWSLPGSGASPVPMGFFQEYTYSTTGERGLFCFPITGMSGSAPTVPYVPFLKLSTDSNGTRFTYQELDCVNNTVSYPAPSFETKHIETDVPMGYKKLFRAGVTTVGVNGMSGTLTPVVDSSNMTSRSCSYTNSNTIVRFMAPAVRYGDRFGLKYSIDLSAAGAAVQFPVSVFGAHFDFSPMRKLTKQAT